MKKVIAIVVALVLVCLSSITAFATHDTHKESLEDYAGQGHLKLASKKQILNFDSLDSVFNGSSSGLYIDTENKKEGAGALAADYGGNIAGHTVFELKNGSINFSVNDRKKQTVKFWFYVNDIDLLACDHDAVHENPQKGSGTLFLTFAQKDSTLHSYRIAHTLEGSGWHMVEIAFSVNNITYDDYSELDLNNIGFMRVSLTVYTGLQVKFDDLQLYTYSNDGYTEPECPNNGRWISTCDFDALDGTTVTEWYASTYDKTDKTQGSSSLSLTAHKQHEDTRAVWGDSRVTLNRAEDVFHYDIYISDLKLIGTDYQVRLSHCESGTGFALYSYGYTLANGCAKSLETGESGFHVGWNSVNIPLQLMKYEYDQEYYKGAFEFQIERIVMFWVGTSETEDYTVKYDNMYVYKADNASEKTESMTQLGPKEEETEEEGGIIKAIGDMLDVDDELALGILIGAIAFVVIIIAAIVVIIILAAKKKKPTAPTPAPVTPVSPKAESPDTEKTSDESK